MSTKPISPSEVIDALIAQIPDNAIRAWNNVISRNFNGNDSKFSAKQITTELRKLTGSGESVIHANYWLDRIKPIYESLGWEIIEDYKENYESIFTFKRND